MDTVNYQLTTQNLSIHQFILWQNTNQRGEKQKTSR